MSAVLIPSITLTCLIVALALVIGESVCWFFRSPKRRQYLYERFGVFAGALAFMAVVGMGGLWMREDGGMLLAIVM